MKISQRLQQIDRMITGHYEHIWDCCCDHGLLGMMLLERNAASQVHFVDCVPSLMVALETRLRCFFPTQANCVNGPLNGVARWQVHCLDVAVLPLAKTFDSDKQLIIIAGVGGELLVDLVRSILMQYPSRHLEFILCPVHHNYYVRQSLAELGFRLKFEQLLEENQRFYEIIHISNDTNAADHRICPTGSLMWENLLEAEIILAKRYLSKVINHYLRMPNNKQTLNIIQAYQAQLVNISDMLVP